nr:hypothetical protein [Nanoarchaeum sp.]
MKYSGILMFGPPASGKGSQAQLLASNLGFYHFSTGEMFRSLKEKKRLNKLEQEILDTMTIDQGNYVSDKQTLALFKQRVYELPIEQKLLLDGIPRTLAQVNPLNKIVDVIALIYIQVPEQELIQRSLKRGRVDDGEGVVKKRLKIYQELTHPILEKYSSRIIEINGNQTREEVQNEIIRKLRENKII